MILARSSVAPTEEPRVRQEHMMSSREHLSRLRSVELLDVDTEPSRDNTDHQWMIEMPGLGLGRDDDASTDDNLNADIAIGRKKAILHGDVIGLRQILYLCSMAHLKSAASPKSTLSIPSQPPPATVTTSNATNKSHEISAIPLPQPQPLAGQLQPVVVKEHALLRVPGENAWIIELATLKDIEIHPHYRPLSQESVSHIPKVAAVVQRRTQSTRLKSAMSAESIQTNHASSLRRVRSFTSFTRRQDQEEVAEGEEEQEAIHIAESSVLFNSYQAPSMVTEDEMASDRAKPYLALYASKKNSKTWSHLVKRATLANLTRLVQSGTRTSPTGPLL
ncbi:hypothetical protein DFQ28_011284 [Apophysomyces sp. BC1034]|nr:hypothetical protein DFQ29_008937 [Apophysomyces sp. BC1021]KAG0191684.1 hypothetical protein DFQ28_011284 [Apophysomyces sp. BC1034]